MTEKEKISRQKMLTSYIKSLVNSNMIYEKRGIYISMVFFFLEKAESVGKRGYKKFCKENADYLIRHIYAKEAILDFMSCLGMGYRESKRKKKLQAQTVEKREIRQQKLINDFVAWLEKENDFSISTLRVYADTARGYFSYFDDFSQDNARQYIDVLESNGFKPRTICLRITGLEHLADFLKKPIKIKRPKIQRDLSTENIPTEKEYEKLLAYCYEKKPKWAFIIRLMATTGCRVSELMQFTYEQIREGTCVLKGKGSKYRRFFFTKELQSEAEDKSGLVCTNRQGNPIGTRGISMMLKSIGEKVGINKEKMHPHAFRHFFAKKYLQKTKDVVGLADILGHSSVDTTRIYLQKSYVEQKKEINRTIDW